MASTEVVGVAKIAAGTGVHGANEDKTGGVGSVAVCAGDSNLPVF